MKDYIQANRAAYEATAEEFQTKKSSRLSADTRIADTFKSFLRDNDKVLELGTGSGQLARLLSERKLEVDAIEYAQNMARLAQLTAPSANIIVDEFLGHDFNGSKYDGIIGIAFVHLFNTNDVKRVMAKINALLATRGILMLTTTVHDRTFDDLVKKTNFETEVVRFRRHYTYQDFMNLFTTSGFKIISSASEHDSVVDGKKWISVMASKI